MHICLYLIIAYRICRLSHRLSGKSLKIDEQSKSSVTTVRLMSALIRTKLCHCLTCVIISAIMFHYLLCGSVHLVTVVFYSIFSMCVVMCQLSRWALRLLMICLFLFAVVGQRLTSRDTTDCWGGRESARDVCRREPQNATIQWI